MPLPIGRIVASLLFYILLLFFLILFFVFYFCFLQPRYFTFSSGFSRMATTQLHISRCIQNQAIGGDKYGKQKKKPDMNSSSNSWRAERKSVSIVVCQ